MRTMWLQAMVLIAVVGLVPATQARARSLSQPHAVACGFTLQTTAPTPTVIGPEEITSRVRFVAQPDSPVVVTRLDFGNTIFILGGELFRFQPDYAVEVFNRGGQLIRNIQVQIQIRSRDGSAGSSHTLAGPFNPGQSGSIRVSRGRAQGTAAADDVRVFVSVESVESDDCLFRPSQALPLPGGPLS